MNLAKRREACLRARVEVWADRLKVRPTQVRIQHMTRKWASCSSAGCITLNRSLLGQSHGFQDYVIVHELLHLRLPNHGKLFKSLLRIHVPLADQYMRA
ncbi:MAG TPA: M48 family metallopeptidase [Gammaproteobacteria bacterium]|nr:M48 family metallopeptidase [Gammaproteobacteria bacterium]